MLQPHQWLRSARRLFLSAGPVILALPAQLSGLPMLNRLATLLLAGSCFTLALYSCRHDREKGDVPNPCATISANPLTFQFLEYSGTPTPDTTYNNQTITFAGPGTPYTAYEWLIGPGTRRNKQQFALSFDSRTVGNITVRLIARRPPNLS